MATFPIPVPPLTATTWPQGVLSSTALAPSVVSSVFQALTGQILGVEPSLFGYAVRIAWQTQGQPFQNVGDDICYVECVETSGSVDGIHNKTYGGAGSNLAYTDLYTRIWTCRWVFYGPNSFDRARLIRTGLFNDRFRYALRPFSLYPVVPGNPPVRVPEIINGQWFERADFECDVYESVTETLSESAVASVSVNVNDDGGTIATIEVEE